MSEIQTRSRKRYRRRATVAGNDAEGDRFAKWLTDMYIEDYASKISDYCKAQLNCEQCAFFNGTCRLNRYPWDWDMKKFDGTP